MSNLGPAFVALLLASVITVAELITSEYSDTFFIVRSSPSLYVYSLIYGALAFITVLTGFPHIEVAGISNSWSQAIAVGLSIKAVLHIRIFSVKVGQGTDPLPFGTETIVQIFEPALKRKVEQDETDGLHRFLDPRAQRYTDPDYVKKQILGNLSRHWTEQQKIAFGQDLDDELRNPTGGIFDAMQLYLIYMGRKNLERIFPLK